MNRSSAPAVFLVSFAATFLAGLAAVCWVGIGYVGVSPLAVAMTALIAAFYLLGGIELWRFHQGTLTLTQAVTTLSAPPAALDAWLARLHPSLQNAVRLRIEGERVALPGPALAPYLAGLLVLLGMLGTFLGMVVTLTGTGAALESATDLFAVRSILAAPVKGLGVAFGTSLAGIATSAMLGLLTAWCRRERLQAAQQLDARIATTLRGFSQAHRREESFKLLQRQADALPQVADRLQRLMAVIEERSEALDQRLVDGQQGFHDESRAAYRGLAESVAGSLAQSLAEGARLAGATLQPVVDSTLAGIARESSSLHIRLAETFEQRTATLLAEVSGRLEAAVGQVAEDWREALALHERASRQLSGDTQQALTAAAGSFAQHSASLLADVRQAEQDRQARAEAEERARLASWTESLAAMAATLRHELQQTGADAFARQQEAAETLARIAREISEHAGQQAERTISEVAKLANDAAEAPRAAAEAMAEMRRHVSEGLARDNALLAERGQSMATLQSLIDSAQRAAGEQRAAIDELVGATTRLLERLESRFEQKLDAEGAKLAAVAAEVNAGAVEVASLGEAFGAGVQQFSRSNDQLGAQLERIEAALGKAMARSDEQLAYAVAQAREVIDLSMLSQRQIVENLQQLAARRDAAAESDA
ncbi:conserved membrane hypothetical protein [Burkholderiales bacterium 8X]|nr:conserved membrane hypothetical protein [Burkholderiales bacterium 8X]